MTKREIVHRCLSRATWEERELLGMVRDLGGEDHDAIEKFVNEATQKELASYISSNAIMLLQLAFADRMG